MRELGPPPDMPPPLVHESQESLWTLGQGNVKDVREILTQNRKLAYTTVMTVLDRLEKRGKVERRKQGRFFVYTPAVSRDALRRLAVQALVEDFFDGSERSLLEYLRPTGGGRRAFLEEPLSNSTLDAALL